MGMDYKKYDKILDPVIIDREFRLWNLFLYRYFKHGGCIVKAVFEGVEDQLSLIEWRDFIIDEKILKPYISILEKRVFRDFYKIKPIIFIYVILFFESCEDFKKVFNMLDKIKVTTTQWYSWYVKPIYAKGSLYDFLNIYSLYLPSLYKPPFYTTRYPSRGPPIVYYNSFSSIRYRSKKISIPSSFKDIDILFPLNFYGVGDDPNKYHFFDFIYEVSSLERNSDVVKKYITVIDSLKSYTKLIFPIAVIKDDTLKVGFLEYDKGLFRYIDNPVYDGNGYKIDFTRKIYSGKNFIIYFKYFWSKIRYKGLSVSINTGFDDFKTVSSWVFPELRYGGRIFYSPSSLEGYKVLYYE